MEGNFGTLVNYHEFAKFKPSEFHFYLSKDLETQLANYA